MRCIISYSALIAILIASKTVATERADPDPPKGWQYPIHGLSHIYPNAGFVEESDAGEVSVVDGTSLRVQGNSRVYLVQDASSLRPWSEHKYVRLPLLGNTLSFTVDLSNVKCNCNAALYLIAPHDPESQGSDYCDITTGQYGPCVEIDLLESNVEVMRAVMAQFCAIPRHSAQFPDGAPVLYR